MKVWSVSPYFGERDIAVIKWREQVEVVNHFAFMEASRNHQGQPRVQVGLPKAMSSFWEVRYGFLDLKRAQPWDMEMNQRAMLVNLMVGLEPEDIVIVSDLDEVLSAATIERIRDGEWELPAQFDFPIHPYCLDWQWVGQPEPGWCRCTVAPGEMVLELGTQGVLEHPKAQVLSGDYGWHFTYQGGAEAIVQKANSIADGWTQGITLEAARHAIATGEDVFGRDRPVREVTLGELPVCVQRNRGRFSHLLRGGDGGQEVRHPEGTEGPGEAEGRDAQ